MSSIKDDESYNLGLASGLRQALALVKDKEDRKRLKERIKEYEVEEES